MNRTIYNLYKATNPQISIPENTIITHQSAQTHKVANEQTTSLAELDILL